MANKRVLQSFFPWTSYPVLLNAPMFGTATAAMASAATKAGGVGLIGGGFDFTPGSKQIDTLESELSKAAATLGIKSGDTLPVAVGFITFHPSIAHFVTTVGPVLEKWKVAGVWLFAPAPSTPSAHAPIIPALRELGSSWGLKVFVQVGTVEAAREAVNDGADVIVAQGIDAGGHQWARGAGIVTLVPEVRDMIDTEFEGRNVGLVAAGGIMDARGVVAATALGAEGAVMGTRFIATKESPAPQAQKEALVKAVDGGVTTIKSTFHDDVQGTGFWPPLYDGRAMMLDSWKDNEEGVSLEENIAKYKAAAEAGDQSRRNIWAGTGIGLIRDVPSSEELVRRTLQETRNIIGKL